MAVVCQEVTADELLLMPDDGFRYELVKGELRQMNPAENIQPSSPSPKRRLIAA
jgi:hypothetical protein